MTSQAGICADCGGLKKYKSSKVCNGCKNKGARNPMAGRTHSEAAILRMSESAPKERPDRRGEKHPLWKGDFVLKAGARIRARKLYPDLQPCEVCGRPDTERHHADGNTKNNSPENIRFLCRPHHRQIHPGHGRVPLRQLPEALS